VKNYAGYPQKVARTRTVEAEETAALTVQDKAVVTDVVSNRAIARDTLQADHPAGEDPEEAAVVQDLTDVQAVIPVVPDEPVMAVAVPPGAAAVQHDEIFISSC